MLVRALATRQYDKYQNAMCWAMYSCVALSGHSNRRPKIGFQGRISINASQKYSRMLQEHSEILSTFNKLPLVFKTFVLSILSGRLRQVLLQYSLYVIRAGAFAVRKHQVKK